MRAVLIDDSADLRRVTRLTIEDGGAVEVVGEAEDGLAGREMIESLRPDVAVIDLHLPDMDGVELIESLRSRSATTRLVAYSTDGGALARALHAGADAAVLKTGKPEALLTALAS